MGRTVSAATSSAPWHFAACRSKIQQLHGESGHPAPPNRSSIRRRDFSGCSISRSGSRGVWCNGMTTKPDDLLRLLAEEPFVRALAQSLVADEADDVVQQAWLRALEHHPSRPAPVVARAHRAQPRRRHPTPFGAA